MVAVDEDAGDPQFGHQLDGLVPLFAMVDVRQFLDRAVLRPCDGVFGKIRLAVEIGVREAQRWPDGVWMIDLSSVLEPQLVSSTVAEACGVSHSEAVGRENVLTARRGRHALLILDNCEQVIDECAAVAGDILARCPDIGILATSRAPLGVAGELVYRLAPLPVTEDAIDLFVDRAEAATSRDLDGTDRSVVASICTRLEGMPLAIEPAAARCGVLSLTEIHDGRGRQTQARRGVGPSQVGPRRDRIERSGVAKRAGTYC